MAQPANDFFFPWEEEGSVENTIIIEEEEGFSEPRTPVSESLSEPPAIEASPPFRTIESLQNFEICK